MVVLSPFNTASLLILYNHFWSAQDGWVQCLLEQVSLIIHFLVQKSEFVGRRDLDDRVLADAHADQAGDVGAERELQPRPRGIASEEMCLLEKVSA